MNTFDLYSNYYDLLYKTKDYKQEVEYVSDLLQVAEPHTKNMLELGSGTGIHASLFAEKGWRVHGIDSSESMLQESLKRKERLSGKISELLTFEIGDVRNYQTDHTFDAVISLFHVASYQAKNKDLNDYFSTASTHVKKGGAFIFDFWYGPAVLSEMPSVRIKRLENQELEIIRIAEPVLLENENRVDVKYQIIIKNKISGKNTELFETHSMRYLFMPEIEQYLLNNGFSAWLAQEWLTGKKPDTSTWGVCVKAIK